MIKSMTGFGKAECSLPGKTVTLELRSLNSKQLDVNFKIPSAYREKESVFRNEIALRFKRGKIDLMIHTDHHQADQAPEINREVIKKYTDQLTGICTELGIKNTDKFELMKIAMRMPEIYSSNKSGPEESEWENLFNSFHLAAGQLDDYRLQEGKALAGDLEKRISSIEKHLHDIDKFESKRIKTVRGRLEQNLKEFFNNNNIDRNRFEQEIIYYLEKLDITEEKVRLSNHIDYFRQTLTGVEPAGKKLGFISQEIGREINTIGSKANDFEIQKLVVHMKDELEKIKEQALNIL